MVATELARVVEVHEDGSAVVEIRRSEACERCGLCAAGASADLMRTEVPSAGEARAGDVVEVEKSPGTPLIASLIVFGVPVAALVVGYFAGSWGAYLLGLGRSAQAAGIWSGLALVGLSYLVVRGVERRVAGDERWQLQVTAIVKRWEG